MNLIDVRRIAFEEKRKDFKAWLRVKMPYINFKKEWFVRSVISESHLVWFQIKSNESNCFIMLEYEIDDDFSFINPYWMIGSDYNNAYCSFFDTNSLEILIDRALKDKSYYNIDKRKNSENV